MERNESFRLLTAYGARAACREDIRDRRVVLIDLDGFRSHEQREIAHAGRGKLDLRHAAAAPGSSPAASALALPLLLLLLILFGALILFIILLVILVGLVDGACTEVDVEVVAE